jgi:predicted dehydrogenase
VDRGKWREGGAPEEGGGLLLDLGPHLIDQAVELLGPARSVYAELRWLRPGAEVDDDVFLALEHESGARSHLWATMLAAQPGPRFRAFGSKAAYVKQGLDVQEDALGAGAGPRDPGFGEEPREAWGTLGSDERAKPVPTEPGRYVAYYEGIEEAIRATAQVPVPLEAGVDTLRVIEAARASSAEGAVVPL